MLDMLGLAGEVAWARLSPTVDHAEYGARKEPPRLVPATPIALFQREHADAWQALSAGEGPDPVVSDTARQLLERLRERGASFFNDLRASMALDDDTASSALGSLVAAGLAASDGFSGLRALVWTAHGRRGARDRRATFAGRWTAIDPRVSGTDSRVRADAVEAQAWALLRRYGVVFRRILARESIAAPWRDLARVYRRLEARGEIRGGRFVSGMSGEQYALPRAVEKLREVRRTPADGRLLAIGTADPLNLAGIITAGERIRSAGRNRMVYRDGVPLAVREGDVVRELAPIDAASARDVARALSGSRGSRVQRVQGVRVQGFVGFGSRVQGRN